MPNRLALAGAVFIAIAELLGPQRASTPAARSGRRYKNGDALIGWGSKPIFVTRQISAPGGVLGLTAPNCRDAGSDQ